MVYTWMYFSSERSASSAFSRSSASGMRKSQTSPQKLYPDIKLPQRDISELVLILKNI